MDIRNVQRTGDMHYVYLPTSWCKKHNISSDSKVGVMIDADGSLVLSPQIRERKPKSLKLTINETNGEIIHKLLVSCYINPLASFQIDLEKELDFTKLLEQKRLISLESVEFDKKRITYEGSISVSDPNSLLKTMVRKVKNMLIVMTKNYDAELIGRYEEEIDRLKMLIDKSIISALTYYSPTKLHTIDLYYISLLAKDLERMVDHLCLIQKREAKFLIGVEGVIDKLKDIIDVEASKKVTIQQSVEFARKVALLKKADSDYNKTRIKAFLETISEVILDRAVTHSLETK
ncbi:MAG TPA: PhoU domain-containing protein [Candidatus Nanoarchaeia archaeon]|nr:PhoU domain-containing protein [Candidatus Nanoarchaeia archaeon]